MCQGAGRRAQGAGRRKQEVREAGCQRSGRRGTSTVSLNRANGDRCRHSSMVSTLQFLLSTANKLRTIYFYIVYIN